MQIKKATSPRIECTKTHEFPKQWTKNDDLFFEIISAQGLWTRLLSDHCNNGK